MGEVDQADETNETNEVGAGPRSARAALAGAGAVLAVLTVVLATVTTMPRTWSPAPAGGRAAAATPPGDEPACDRQHPQPPSAPLPSGPDYPTNAAGQTYGAARDNQPQPDLIAAIGDCGRTGYVRSDAFPDRAPGELDTGVGSTPVYETDGSTQIDTVTRPAADAPPAPVGPDADDVQGRWSAVATRVGLVLDFAGAQLTASDGCATWRGMYRLEDGELALASPLVREAPAPPGCIRSGHGVGRVPALVAGVRHVSRDGDRLGLHQADHRIVAVLAPAD